MYKKLGVLLTCSLAIAACTRDVDSIKKAPQAPAVPQTNNKPGASGDDKKDLSSPYCVSPFQDFGDKEVRAEKLKRKEGQWVLVATFGSMYITSSNPNQHVLNSLTPEMREQLEEAVKEKNN